MILNEFFECENPASVRNWRATLLCSTAICFATTMAHAQTIIEGDASGGTAAVVVVTSEEERSDQTIRNTTSSNGNAVFVNGPTADLTGNNLTIETSGTSGGASGLSAGIRAHGGANVELNGGSVATTGASDTRGILGVGGSSITTDGTAISTLGANSHGVHVLSGSTALIQGGLVSTQGANSFGLYAQNAASSLTTHGVNILTSGADGFGAFALSGGVLHLNGGSIETSGLRGHGAVAGLDSSIELNGTSINTSGERGWGLVADQANTTIDANDVDIVTEGFHAYGAYASATGSATANITLNGGSITTANANGQFVQGTEARGYALFAQGNGASIDATGTNITTLGQRSYGAHATGGASMDLSDLSITTDGFMAYGVYLWDADTQVNLSNVDVTTNGQAGDAITALDGSQVEIDGGTITVNGEPNPNPNSPGEVASGLISGGTINARGVTVITNGASSRGVRAGVNVSPAPQAGLISLTDSSVTVNGSNAIAAEVAHGGTLSTTRTSLSSTQGVGISLFGNATVNLVDTSITAGEETFRSNLNSAGQLQQITVSGASVATENNGTLLQVNRTADGADGIVDFTLGSGSVTSGDILDEGERSEAGGTDVTMEEGASWSGVLRGIRNFFAAGEVTAVFEDDAEFTGDFATEDGSSYTFAGDATFGGDVDSVGSDFVFSDESDANIAGDLNATTSTFNFGTNGTTTIAGSVNGTGSVFNFGVGGLTTIGGDVSLAQGSRTSGGSIDTPITVGGDVSIDDSSFFGGNWDVAGNVVNGGTIAPGNSIGVVTIGGDITFEAGSSYDVEVDPDTGESDLIAAGGTAFLNGGSVVHIGMTGSYDPTSTYTILTADGGIDGEFDDVTSVFAFLDPTLGYGSNAVTLTLERNNIGFEDVGVTRNQTATGAGVESLGFGNDVYDAVVQLDEDAARFAFDQLSGEIHASANTTLVEDSRHIRNAANDRIRAAFGNVAAAPLPVLSYGPDGSLDKAPGLAPGYGASPTDFGTAAWGTAFGSWGSTDGNGNAAELDRSTGGLMVGLDGTLDTWRVGVLAGYSRSSFDVDDRASSGDADNYHLGVYGGTQWGAVGFRTGLAYTWSDIETQRSVAFPGFTDTLSADYDAGTFQAFGELGYTIETAAASFEPFINLAHVNVRTDGFTETGGAAALSSARSSTDTTFTTIGVRASTNFAVGDMTATARGMIGWRHAFGDTTPLATNAFAGGDAFTVAGVPVAKDAAVIEAGIDFAITPAATLGVSYQGQFGSGASDHGGRVGMNIRF